MSHTTIPDLSQLKIYNNLEDPHCTKEWFKLSDDIHYIESAKKFKRVILDFIKS